MRNLLKLMLIVLISALTVNCVNKQKPVTVNDENIEEIAKLVKQSIYNPTFSSSDEFFQHIVLNKELRRCQAILDTMSLSTANNIFNVVLNREGYVSYYNFLKEYDALYDNVYRYLENNNIKNIPDTISDAYKRLDECNININDDERKPDDVGSNVSRKRTTARSIVGNPKSD